MSSLLPTHPICANPLIWDRPSEFVEHFAVWLETRFNDETAVCVGVSVSVIGRGGGGGEFAQWPRNGASASLLPHKCTTVSDRFRFWPSCNQLCQQPASTRFHSSLSLIALSCSFFLVAQTQCFSDFLQMVVIFILRVFNTTATTTSGQKHHRKVDQLH